MVFKNLCVFVLWTKVDSALEGLIHGEQLRISKFCSESRSGDFSRQSTNTKAVERLGPTFELLLKDQTHK